MITAQHRTPVWQRRGTNIEGMTLEQGLAHARVDYEVGIAELRADIPGAGVERVRNYQVTYRLDTREPIAPVGARYHVVQTREAIKVVEAMALGGWTPTFAGSLRGGSAVFMAGRLDVNLVSKEVDPYLCFVNSFDGTSGLKFACTPLRPACTNMVRAVFNTRFRSRPVVSLRHTSNIMSRVDEAATVLRLTQNYYKYLDAEIERLMETELTAPRLGQVLDVVAPLMENGVSLDGRRREVRQEKRDRIVTALQYSNTIPDDLRESAWGMYSALTELEQWGRDELPTDSQADQLFGSHLSITPVRNTSDRVYRVMERWLQPA